MNLHNELAWSLDQWIQAEVEKHPAMTVEGVLTWLLRASALGLYNRVGCDRAERLVLEVTRDLAFLQTVE